MLICYYYKYIYAEIMRKDFFIFRHGQTDLNAYGVWQGCATDAILNATGVQQAKSLAASVCSLRLTNLFSSPLIRAVQTANAIILGGYEWLPVVIYQGLRECHFGEAEQLTFEQTEIKYGKDFVNSLLYPTKDTWNLRFPGGESKYEVFNRVMKCFSQIINSNLSLKNNRIGIVCHAGVISALECGLGLRNVSYENCSVLHLRYDTETEQFEQIFD